MMTQVDFKVNEELRPDDEEQHNANNHIRQRVVHPEVLADLAGACIQQLDQSRGQNHE